MKKVLITGATGFVGNHLIKQLLSSEPPSEIYGTTRKEISPEDDSRVHFVQIDLLDKEAIVSFLKEIQPQEIYHLAAQSNVPQSIKDPISTFHANVDSQLNLLMALCELKMIETKVLVVSSAEVYGYIAPEYLPVDENTPHRPANPYAVSKIAQDYLGFQFNLSYNLPIVRVRPFNHVGPGQAPHFVMADFAKQVAEIEKGIKEPLMRVGNMVARRDFTDVRDMVKLYPLLLEKGIPGEVYNAGSGKSHSVQEILDLLMVYANVDIKVEIDQAKMRASDVPNIVADITKVQKVTGWKPQIPFEQTVKDTLDYFRNVV